MARFYTTSSPQFVEDIMYEPPWKLMQDVLATKQKGYDDAIISTELLKNLDIKHRDTPEENQAVAEIKNYWNSEVDSIQNQLKQNPNSYASLIPKIRDLSRRLSTDMKEGNIAKIQSTYDKFMEYQKNFEKVKSTDPIRYAKLIQEADARWGGNSLKNGVWKQEDMYDTPDFEKLVKNTTDKVKADFEKHGTEHFNGLNITKIVNGVKQIDPLKLQKAVVDSFMMDPANKAYASQVNRLGLGNFEVSPFIVRYRDNSTGKVLSEKDYKALSEEEKKKYTEGYIPNSEHALYNTLNYAGAAAYKEWETDQETKGNVGALAQFREANANARDAANRKSRENIANATLNWEKDKYNIDQQNKKVDQLDKIISDPKASPELKQNAEIERNRILGYGNLMEFQGQTYDLASALGSGKKDIIFDAVNRSNLGDGMKSLIKARYKDFSDTKGKTPEQILNGLVDHYLKTPAGKKELSTLSGKYNSTTTDEQLENGAAFSSSRYTPQQAKEKAKEDILENFRKIVPVLNKEIGKYNAGIQQESFVLTSTEQNNMGRIMNSSPDSWTYFTKEGKPLSSTEVGADGGIKPIQVGAGGKGKNSSLITEVEIGGQKYFAVTNDSQRTSGAALAQKHLMQQLVSPNSALGLNIHNTDMSIRTNSLNELIRANTNSGTQYTKVIKDPVGTDYGIQGVASGSTKTGVGLVHVYKPSTNGEYSPLDKITDTPVDMETATIIINRANK